MAKKNSSKTATEKAIQSSEPRVTTYRGWRGVNYVDSPLTWEPLEQGPGKYRQSDLPANYLMVQNNLVTTPTLGVETRDDSQLLVKISDYEYEVDGWYFTGVAAVYHKWMFAVMRTKDEDNKDYDRIVFFPLTEIPFDSDEQHEPIEAWQYAKYIDPVIRVGSQQSVTIECKHITEIGFYENNLVAAISIGSRSYIALAKIDMLEDESDMDVYGIDWDTLDENEYNKVITTPMITDPNISQASALYQKDWPFILPIGMDYTYKANDPDHPNATHRIEVIFSYTNRMGSSLVSYPATVYVEFSPALWSSAKYLSIRSRDNTNSVWDNIYTSQTPLPPPQAPEEDRNIVPGSGIQGLDIYARELENTDWVFVGHVDIDKYDDQSLVTGTQWMYNWLGNMTDTSQWANSQLVIPSENSSEGPNVTHFSSHDSRMYYWGQPDKLYRLYIGGNPGSEFSIARGLGGAWIDIEPGSGFEIAGTAKWKASQGANIITIMCGNRNTSKVKRFNLIETNLTYTNEISYKSYMYEEVSNVVGCNSRWGYGVYDEGLYSLNRYGLMLTTMAVEYNNQMKTQNISEVIKPIFSERIGARLRDCRMICIDGVIYIALSEETVSSEPTKLDNVVLCYDVGLQAWYTFTHDESYSLPDIDHITQLFNIDSDEYIEGVGTVTDREIRVYPTTGIQRDRIPKFEVLLETGELIPKMPKQTFDYIEQLEFRFDYLIAPNGDKDDDFNYVYVDGQRIYCPPATILIEGIDYYGRSFEITKYLNFKSRGHHGLEGEQRSYTEWVRVGKLVQSLRIRIKGHARFRLTHIVNKMYTQSDRIGTPYGFDASDSYYNRHRGKTKIHHYINDYNNLRDAVVS